MNNRLHDLALFTPLQKAPTQIEQPPPQQEEEESYLLSLSCALTELADRIHESINQLAHLLRENNGVSSFSLVKTNAKFAQTQKEVIALVAQYRQRLEDLQELEEEDLKDNQDDDDDDDDDHESQDGLPFDRPKEKLSVLVRMQENLIRVHQRRLASLLANYQQVIGSYERQNREAIRRDRKILFQTELEKPRAEKGGEQEEEEEEEGAYLGTDLGQQLLIYEEQKQSSLLNSERSNADRHLKQLALWHLKEENDDIRLLEQKMIELYSLAVDMANSTQTQDEILNRISTNVEQSKEWTGSALVNLKESRKIQTKIRKQKCLCCLATTATATACAGTMAATVAPLVPAALCLIL